MKKFLTIVCLAAFLVAGVFAAVEMPTARLPQSSSRTLQRPTP